jgi:HSP20 family molecular chaperone IbpA
MAAMKETTVPQKVENKVPDTREETRTMTPPVDIFDTDEGLAVVADLPGVDKDTVEIGVENNVLTLKGVAKPMLTGDPIHREYELLNFFRQFQLSEAVDQERIRADMKFGVLTIHLPRVAAQQPRKIAVNVAA